MNIRDHMQQLPFANFISAIKLHPMRIFIYNIRRKRQGDPEFEKKQVNIAANIPAYHVEQHIGKVIRNLPDFIDHIIIVDDASQDGTSREVESIRDDRIHLTRHQSNQGVGEAMISGYHLAFDKGADIAVKIDRDDQMDPAYIQRLITPIIESKADYAKGNRFLHIKDLRRMPLVRRIGNLGLSFLTKLASG